MWLSFLFIFKSATKSVLFVVLYARAFGESHLGLLGAARSVVWK